MTGPRRHCSSCTAALRPKGSLVADYPNTVIHAGLGLCQPCRIRQQQAENMPTCALCDIQMRPKWMPKDDWPGTNAHLAKGVCMLCYHKERRAKAKNSAVKVTGPTIPVALRDLGEEIEFLLSIGDDRNTLYRNAGVSKMAVEYAMKALKI